GPIWRLVVTLALPVLAQQFLILSVGLSDRFLAGHLQPLPRQQRAEAAGHRLLAMGQYAGGSLIHVLAAEAAWGAARQIESQHVAYQSAQTMAIYVGWAITSFTVLVSVGSTALVARFIGAGDQQGAIKVTNQSILLAMILGLVGTAAGVAGLDWFVALMHLQGHAAEFAAQYMRPLLWVLVFQVIESAGLGCLVGAGDTRMSFYVLGGVAVINFPLAWGLFLGLGPLPEL